MPFVRFIVFLRCPILNISYETAPSNCGNSPEPLESSIALEPNRLRGIALVFIGRCVVRFGAFIIYRTKHAGGAEFGSIYWDLEPNGIPDHSNPFVDGVMTLQQRLGGGHITSKITPVRRVDIIHRNRHDRIVGKLFSKHLYRT